MDQKLIKRLASSEDLVVPALFKPVQFNIIKKLYLRKKLTDNEKRYLRGNMKKKLEVLEKIEFKKEQKEDYVIFLNSLNSYYVTGLEALKHNGFGWYFKTKVIEVINTKIEGKLRACGKTFKLIRVKSIGNADYKTDKNTCLKYATNEQIFKDMKTTKNKYALIVWKQMLSRYGRFFLNNYNTYKFVVKKPTTIDYLKYGV